MTARREVLTLLGAGIVSMPFASRAQPARTMPRLGILHPGSVEASAVYKVLVVGLADRGYVEGKNIAFELRSGNGKPETLPSLAADLVRTAVAPTWDDIGKLAVIATIRTMINYFLAKDIASFEGPRTGTPSPASPGETKAPSIAPIRWTPTR